MLQGPPRPAGYAFSGSASGLCGGIDATTHAFFLDVDGTLLDIAARPNEVVVPYNLPDTLAALARRAGGALALVSGRTIADLDALFGPRRFAAAGSHGAESRTAPSGDIVRAAPLERSLRRAVGTVASEFNGVFAEDKETAIAVHYRAQPTVEPVLRRALLSVVGGFPDVTLLPGHCVFEIKRKGHDKGTAVDAFLALPAFAGRTPVFIGDDVTDEAGFRAVRAAGGIAIAVGIERAGAQTVLPDPSAVRALITHLAAEPRQLRR
ncbi:trehalose-phosphatase [Xanthobacter sp. KR7-65]|uniref:trehalose-phosphatase n=1 Tax=Xanthobacter sp. KR7-65 TaxID=3156612 RepID=UPI0032B3289B